MFSCPERMNVAIDCVTVSSRLGVRRIPRASRYDLPQYLRTLTFRPIHPKYRPTASADTLADCPNAPAISRGASGIALTAANDAKMKAPAADAGKTTSLPSFAASLAKAINPERSSKCANMMTRQ